MGGRIAWTPTYSAKADREARGLGGGISLFKGSETLLPGVHSILELIKSQHGTGNRTHIHRRKHGASIPSLSYGYPACSSHPRDYYVVLDGYDS